MFDRLHEERVCSLVLQRPRGLVGQRSVENGPARGVWGVRAILFVLFALESGE